MHVCPCCQREVTFLWRCQRCGFAICQRCVDDNIELFTCNYVTWPCPDCGRSNSF